MQPLSRLLKKDRNRNSQEGLQRLETPNAASIGFFSNEGWKMQGEHIVKELADRFPSWTVHGEAGDGYLRVNMGPSRRPVQRDWNRRMVIRALQ